MRLFTAVELPESARRHLQEVRHDLQVPDDMTESVSWVRGQNLHVTLKFLGEMADQRLDEIVKRLSTVDLEEMLLYADGLLFLPPRGPVRVIASSLGGDVGRMRQLQRQIELVCTEFGVEQDRRPYTPHITLGRSRRGEQGSGVRSLRSVTLKSRWPGPAFRSADFSLVQSRLDPAGAIYETLWRFPVT